jgi:hypothetical protein
MAIKFNPLTGNFDFTGSGGGGGGSAFFAGEVATYADLPLDGTAALDSRWLVRSNSGTWPFSSYKQAGVYVRVATLGSSRDNDYTLTDTTFFDVMSDNKFLVFDNSDATKGLAFDVGTNVPTSSTVTLTVPAASGTIARTETFAAPPAIGSTTPAAGTFTTLTANTQLVGPQGNDVGSATANAITVGAANTGFFVSNTQLVAVKGGANIWYADNSNRFVIAAGMTNGAAIEQTGAPLGFSRNISLFPDANGELHQRSTTQAQAKIIYGTFTSATNYQRLAIKTKAVTLSALSGASVATTGGFIPDGAVLVGLTTRVSTAITGATGYDIGDGSDADRWGANVAIALNTSSDNTNWTATTIQCFTAAQEVTLTAVGSNFTGGAVVIVAHYLAGEAD